MSDGSEIAYRRILLKFSGEALMGEQNFGIDPAILNQVAAEVKQVVAAGVQVGIVIGGGNIFRGVSLAASGMDRVAADQMGMLATVINSLAMQDAMRLQSLPASVMSAFPIHGVCEAYTHRDAMAHLDNGRIVIFAAGTGNPFFTTDTAASLRGVEIAADVVIKATKVDGVFSDDPEKNPDAKRYSTLSYDEVIEQKLAVMDTTAIVLCRDNNVPIRVFNMNKQGALMNVVKGQDEGTLVK
jgi:uridylate kinase